MSEQTPQEQINEIYTMLKMMGEDVKKNKENIQDSFTLHQTNDEGREDHEERIGTMEKLIDMMVNCGTAKDLDKENALLRERIARVDRLIGDLLFKMEKNIWSFKKTAIRERITEIRAELNKE